LDVVDEIHHRSRYAGDQDHQDMLENTWRSGEREKRKRAATELDEAPSKGPCAADMLSL